MKEQDTPKALAKSAFRFGAGTLLSRIGGLARDISLAFCFGVDPALAAFFVAFRFSNLLRRIFGEGVLLNSFVPHFEAYRIVSEEKAAQFFRDTFVSLTFLLILIIGSVEGGLFVLLNKGGFSEGNREIISLTMMMFPGLLFVCLFSLSSGFLQCQKKFFLSGFAPLLFNLVWIVAIWQFRDFKKIEAMGYLALSVTLAYFLQWAIIAPNGLLFIWKHLSWKQIFLRPLVSMEMWGIFGSLSLSLISVSAVQVNGAIDAIFARHASLEGPAFLNFAIHLQQLPLALFGIGLSTALLPSLSRARSNELAYTHLLRTAVFQSLFFLIPCVLAIFVLGASSVSLIYGRGEFQVESVVKTTFCLWGYGIGLVPMGLAILLAPCFYAMKDYWTPMYGSLISVGANFLLNLLFVFVWKLGPPSLAFATSLGALINCIFLMYHLSNRFLNLRWISLLFQLFPIIAASLISAGVTLYCDYRFYEGSSFVDLWKTGTLQPLSSFLSQVFQFCTLFSIFIFLLFGFLVLFVYASRSHSLLNGRKAFLNLLFLEEGDSVKDDGSKKEIAAELIE